MTDKKKLVQVKDVMQTQFDWIDGMMTIAQALEQMEHTDALAMMVKKRHEDDEYGMLLLTDIARHVLGKDRAPDRVNVYEIMAKPVLKVQANMDIRYCARLFDRFTINRAPVVENEEVIGIVSFTDIVLKGMKPNLMHY